MKDKSWDVAITYNKSFGPDPAKIDFTIQKETIKAFKIRLDQKKDDIKNSVIQSLERLLFYRKNLKSLRASEKLSAEVLEGQRLNFQLGKISLLDVTRYQQDFDNASISVVQGESRLIMSWFELLFETGVLANYLEVNKAEDVNSDSVRSVHGCQIIPLETAEDEK